MVESLSARTGSSPSRQASAVEAPRDQMNSMRSCSSSPSARGRRLCVLGIVALQLVTLTEGPVKREISVNLALIAVWTPDGNITQQPPTALCPTCAQARAGLKAHIFPQSRFFSSIASTRHRV